jgi:hypothetical protein
VRPVRLSAALSAAAIASLLAVAPAQAGTKSRQTVRCAGTADYCTATVPIGGGAKNRLVTIELTDTDLQPVGVRTAGGAKPGGFKVTKAGLRLGGSEYRFTLNAAKSNPRRARILVSFARGQSGGKFVTGGWVNATLRIENLPNAKVSIVGGGGGTSNCTKDETVTSYMTTSNRDDHSFGFNARADGSCFWQESWSRFVVTITSREGVEIKRGHIWIEHSDVLSDYYTNCSRFGNNWVPTWNCEDWPRTHVDRGLIVIRPA